MGGTCCRSSHEWPTHTEMSVSRLPPGVHVDSPSFHPPIGTYGVGVIWAHATAPPP